MKDKMKFYKYERQDHYYTDEYSDYAYYSYTSIELKTFDLIKETPKGYWIRDLFEKRWVSKTARKRFAYPTKEQALKSLCRRTEVYKNILTSRIKRLNNALYRIKVMQEREKQELLEFNMPL